MNQTRTPAPSLLDFPHIWWQSFTDLRIYRALVHLPVWFGLLYTWITYALLALGATLIFQFRTLPVWTQTAISTWEELRDNWPQELTLQYEDQQLSFAGISEPLVVSYPSAWKVPNTFPQQFLYISPSLETTPSPFSDLDQAVLFGITPNQLVIQPTKQGEVSEANATVWSDLIGQENFTVQKSDLVTHNESMQQGIRRAIQLLVVPYFLVAWLGLWLARLIFLALYALFAQTLFWMFGTKIKYTAMFRLGLFTLPVVELVPLFWRALYGSVFWPGSYWWIWLAFTAFLAWYNRRGKILQL